MLKPGTKIKIYLSPSIKNLIPRPVIFLGLHAVGANCWFIEANDNGRMFIRRLDSIDCIEIVKED